MAVVEVIDERRDDPERRMIATHENVPDQWTITMIVKRFGIPDHFGIRVTRVYPHGGDQAFYRHPIGTAITTIR